MDQIVLSPFTRPGTQAAEGLPRWRWTTAEIERAAAAGLFADEDRIELIGGEIVPMSPKGIRHERLRNMLDYLWTRMAPRDVMVVGESQFNLEDGTFVNPDILLHPMAIRTDKLRGPDALLVVEVAETSLSYDRKTKLSLYASHGVPEYWIINAVTRETTVHREPLGRAYGIAEEIPADRLLVPSLVPVLAISLQTLDLD